MHDQPSKTDTAKLSHEIIYVVHQLERMSANGPLNLDEQSVQHLLRDLKNTFRHSVELEKEFLVLQSSRQRLARMSGIYDVPPQSENRCAAFKIVGGTDTKGGKSDE